ncbi:MAG TPA: methyltransferase domain-containing protein [Mycobacteriales bacterium]|nr:methyltransferase domain-containing protein [Mycobacteriales bacterium]
MGVPEAAPAAAWDPGQYLRYADERSRPFFDLLAPVPAAAASLVVDLGCGPGTLTRTLAQRWPDAEIVGVDSSEEMISRAASEAGFARLSYVCADLRSWLRTDSADLGAPDVVVANAVLQWVPGHLALIEPIASWLAPGGTFAFQVPANFDSPSHTVIRELRESPRWRDRVGARADRQAGVESPETYLEALAAAGLEPDVWQTTYLHRLTGENPVLEWVKGTALRPVLTALAGDEAESEAFLAECAEGLRDAYPAGADGTTVFPFRRTFAIGTAKAAA